MPEKIQDVQDAIDIELRRFHLHRPHGHRPHHHNPHNHNPHRHRPHAHNPHKHWPVIEKAKEVVTKVEEKVAEKKAEAEMEESGPMKELVQCMKAVGGGDGIKGWAKNFIAQTKEMRGQDGITAYAAKLIKDKANGAMSGTMNKNQDLATGAIEDMRSFDFDALKTLADSYSYNFQNAELVVDQAINATVDELTVIAETVKDEAGANGQGSCVLRYIILPGIIKAEPYLKELTTNAVSKLFDLWEDVKTNVLVPKLEGIVTKVVDKLVDSEQKATLDRLLEGAAHGVCNAQTKLLAIHGKPGLVSMEFCLAKTAWKLTESYRQTGSMTTIAEAVIPVTIDNIFANLWKSTFSPLAIKLVAGMMTGLESIFQVILPACSTLPTAGAAICVPFTLSLSATAMRWVPLKVSNAITKIYDATRDYLKSLAMPKITEALTNFENGKAMGHLTDIVAVANASAPLVIVAVPLIVNTFSAHFSVASDVLTSCEDNLNDVYDLIAASACPKLIQMSPPSPPPSPPTPPPGRPAPANPPPAFPPPNYPPGCNKNAVSDVDEMMPTDDIGALSNLVFGDGAGTLKVQSADFDGCGGSNTPQSRFAGKGQAKLSVVGGSAAGRKSSHKDGPMAANNASENLESWGTTAATAGGASGSANENGGGNAWSASFDTYIDERGSGYFTVEGRNNQRLSVFGGLSPDGGVNQGGIRVNFTAIKFQSGYRSQPGGGEGGERAASTISKAAARGVLATELPLDYVQFYFTFSLGDLQLDKILVALFTLGTHQMESSWMPTFKDVRMIIAKGTSMYLTVPSQENRATSSRLGIGKTQVDAEQLKCQMNRLNSCFGETPTDTWIPQRGEGGKGAFFPEYANISDDGMYLRTTVEFDPESVLGKIVDFLDTFQSKENGHIKYDIETHFPIFKTEHSGNALQAKLHPIETDTNTILEGASLSITTAGQCMGSTAQQFDGQEPVAYFKDGVLQDYGAELVAGVDVSQLVPCYPDGFISVFKERVLKWSGFKRGGQKVVEAELTGVRIAMPTVFFEGEPGEAMLMENDKKVINMAESRNWKLFNNFETRGNDIKARVVYTKQANPSNSYQNPPGNTFFMGIQYSAQISNLFGIPLTLDTVSFAFVYRWNAVPITRNGPLLQIGATMSVALSKAGGAPKLFSMGFDLQVPIPKSGNAAMEGARLAANVGHRTSLKNADMHELVQFAREFSKNSDAEEKPIDDGVKSALESIEIKDLTVCGAPNGPIRFMNSEEGTGSGLDYECPSGYSGNVKLKVFKLEAELKYNLIAQQGSWGPTRKYKKVAIELTLSGVKDLRKQIITAIIDCICFGNDKLEAIVNKAAGLMNSFGIEDLFVDYKNEKHLGVWWRPALDVKLHFVTSGSDVATVFGWEMVGPLNNIPDAIMLAGQAAIAKAVGVFGMPPYDNQHVCAKNKHCRSGNCYLGFCTSCAHHITKGACEITQRWNEPLGCQWEANPNNCKTWASNTKGTCEISDGCTWTKDTEDCEQFNRKEPICKGGCNCKKSGGLLGYCYGCHGRREIGGSGRCEGTWHGGTSAGTCHPKKCNTLPVCNPGSTCYNACSDADKTNAAWPTYLAPATVQLVSFGSLVEDRIPEHHRPVWRNSSDLTSHADFVARTFADDPATAAAKKKKMRRMVQQHLPVYNHSYLLSTDEPLSVAELLDLKNSDYTSRNATLDDDHQAVPIMQLTSLVMHELILGEHPAARDTDHRGHATEQAKQHYKLALTALEVAFDKIGIKDAEAAGKLTSGVWRREVYPKLVDHLHGLALKRAQGQRAPLPSPLL
jgi:hypothetical protein